MKQYSFYSRIVFALAFTAVIIGFSAFSQKQQKSGTDSFRKEQFSKDDDTSTSRKRNRDEFNWNFDRLDDQMKQLDLQMKNLDFQMKNFNMEKLQEEINEGVKKIDVEKITEQIDKSIKNIDWGKMNNEVVKNLNVSKLKMEEAAKEMDHVKANLERQKVQIKLNTGRVREDIENAMRKAKRSIENAKEELRNMKEFTDALEKDGLINKSKAYKIEVKNSELYIDGKKQSKEISDKYRQYYRKSNFTINMDEEDDTKI